MLTTNQPNLVFAILGTTLALGLATGCGSGGGPGDTEPLNQGSDLGPSVWSQWQYDFGLVAYTNGLYSDANNEPDGQEWGAVSYQVVTYFTDPRGRATSAAACGHTGSLRTREKDGGPTAGAAGPPRGRQSGAIQRTVPG